MSADCNAFGLGGLPVTELGHALVLPSLFFSILEAPPESTSYFMYTSRKALMHSRAGKLDRSYRSRGSYLPHMQEGCPVHHEESISVHIATMQHLLEPYSQGGKVGLDVAVALSQ